jgi:hypothetical protein
MIRGGISEEIFYDFCQVLAKNLASKYFLIQRTQICQELYQGHGNTVYLCCKLHIFMQSDKCLVSLPNLA